MTPNEWIAKLRGPDWASVVEVDESDIAAIQADAERAGEERGVRKVQEEIDTLKSALNNSLAELHALKAKIERYEKALRFYEHVAALDGVDRSVATEALEEPK